MTEPASTTLLLADPEADQDIRKIGTYRLEPDGPDQTRGIRLLDIYDQPIRKSGCALVEAGDQLILLGSDAGAISQPAQRNGNFVADLADGPVKAALSDLSPLRALLVLGEGQVSTRQLRLLDDENKTLARANLQSFRNGVAEGGLTVSTVQALRGYRKPYDALVARLRADGASEEAWISHLYALLAPDQPDYIAKPDVAMTGDETAFHAAHDIIAAYLHVARQNEAGIADDLDTEFLHDYRVALRKIRSVVSLFKGVYGAEETAALKAAFSGLMARTGRLRDLDVYLLDRDHYFGLLPDTLQDGLTIMFDLFAAERAQVHADLTAWLQSPDYLAQTTALQAKFDDPASIPHGPNAGRLAHDYACQLIWARYRKACKIARRIDDTTPDDDVHELRIHCKKLRYLMEFFGPLFPEDDFKSIIKPLKRLQDTLGLFNDYSVQQVSLEDFITAHASRGRRKDLTVAKSIGALIAVLHQRQLDERAKVVDRFAHFDSKPVQATFRRLFAEQKG